MKCNTPNKLCKNPKIFRADCEYHYFNPRPQKGNMCRQDANSYIDKVDGIEKFTGMIRCDVMKGKYDKNN